MLVDDSLQIAAVREVSSSASFSAGNNKINLWSLFAVISPRRSYRFRQFASTFSDHYGQAVVCEKFLADKLGGVMQ